MPQSVEKIEAEIIKRITPSPEERKKVETTVKSLLEKVERSIKRYDLNIEPMAVGSIARDTWLPDPDIDIFIAFPLKITLKDMERIGLEIGRDVLEKGERKYAEHPYTHGIVDGFDVDLVPCYKIEKPEQRMTAVDRSPLHQKYVIDHLKEEQKKEVRLLKRFMKGIGVYSAEAKVQGFSGYLTELLVLKYGSFMNVIKSALNWRGGFRIELIPSEKMFEEPLVVIDPIDAQRNVASALSLQNLTTFIHACKEFLKAPRTEFFYPKLPAKLTTQKIAELIKKKGTFFLALVFEAPKVVEDVLYPQLRKCEHSIRTLCIQNGFSVHNSDFEIVGSEAVILFEFEVFELPKVMKHRGPPIWIKNAESFYEKWSADKNAVSKPYVDGEHLVVDILRKWMHVHELVKAHLGELSLGKNINDSIKKRHSILVNEELANEKYADFLSRYLNKKMPWED